MSGSSTIQITINVGGTSFTNEKNSVSVVIPTQARPTRKTGKKNRTIIIIEDEEVEEFAPAVEEVVICEPVSRTYKPVLNETRVKKGFQGVIHKHETNDEGSRKCPYCDYNCIKGSTLSMHITRTHPFDSQREISPHVCQYCNKGFQASTNLAHHIKNHHEIVYHKCPVDGCSYENAKNTTTLAAHISSKHLKHCYANDTCLSCNTYVGSSIKYHVAFCSSASPLYKPKKI